MIKLNALRIASRPIARTSTSVLSRRCLAINAKDFKPSPGFQLFSEELELAIRKQIESLPSAGKVYQNPDGTTRNPSDQELKDVAALSYLANAKRMTYPDWFKLSREQMATFKHNQDDLSEFYSTGKRILDKIPVEDKETGEITWTIIREKQKEGWEGLMYYGYIPGGILCVFFALFLDKENISDWAMEELRLRAQERYNDTSTELINDGTLDAEELKKRDALIVERIISGEYDRLAGLKKAGAELPTSLI